MTRTPVAATPVAQAIAANTGTDREGVEGIPSPKNPGKAYFFEAHFMADGTPIDFYTVFLMDAARDGVAFGFVSLDPISGQAIVWACEDEEAYAVGLTSVDGLVVNLDEIA